MQNFWYFSFNLKRTFRRNKLWDKLFTSIYVCDAVKHLSFPPCFYRAAHCVKKKLDSW